ncbi:MAG TPA: ABC transporter permease [Bryobacteraceae bacterium]|nr:ABC transporter permease [Bryobacteraceae bacterium]
MGIPRWIKYLRRGIRDQELAREIEHYLELETSENVARGMNADEARAAAMRKFGNTTACREAEYDMNTVSWMDTMVRHITYGARQLRQSPGFTATAILSLTLGIGANTAVFQLLNAVRLRSLPVQRPHELVELMVEGGNRGFGSAPGVYEASNPLWEQVRTHQQVFSSVFAWGSSNFPVGEAANVRRTRGVYASGAMFSTLGIKAHRGRLLAEEDDRRGCAPGPVVISHGYWQSEFGGRDNAIGAKLIVLNKPFYIVGVTPPDFFGLEVGRGFDFVLPNCARGSFGTILDARHVWNLHILGRLKSGMTVEQASAHLKTVSGNWFEQVTPIGYDAQSLQRWKGFRFIAQPGGGGVSELRREYERSLWLLLGITGLVLLMTCATLANLLLARAAGREREIAVRLAIGASRGRLIGQFLTESLLLATIGAVFACGVAALLSRTLIGFLSVGFNSVQLDLSLDWRLLSFIAFATVATCLLFGFAPAWRAAAGEPMSAMKSGGRSMTADRRHASLQQALIVCQIAVSAVLLVGSFLFVGSFRNLATADTGFDRTGITFHFVDFSALKPTRPAIRPLQEQILQRVGSVPGVETVSTTTNVPLSGSSWMLYTTIPGSADPNKSHSPQFTWVRPNYFRAMRIPLLAGRDISAQDTAESAKVLVVNEEFVKQLLGGGNPIGRMVKSLAEPGFPEATYQVVGVVGNTRYANLREGMPPIAYASELQNPQWGAGTSLLVKSSAPTAQITGAIRQALAESFPAARVEQISLEGVVSERVVRERLLAWLSGFFGLVALGLAVIGVYGVISHAAARRRTEVGIRLALGAGRGHVLGLFLRRVAILLGVGLGLGLTSSYALARVTATLLYGIRASDPVVYVVAAVALAGVAGFAALAPSARAARLNAVDSLRAD